MTSPHRGAARLRAAAALAAMMFTAATLSPTHRAPSSPNTLAAAAWSEQGGPQDPPAGRPNGQGPARAADARAGASSIPPQKTIDGRDVGWGGFAAKSVVLAFFSQRQLDLPACLACYQQIHDERDQANVTVLGVCIDGDRPNDLRALLQEHKITFPIVVDAERVLLTAYQPKSMPQVYFYAEQGRPIGDLPGYPEEGSPTPAAFYTNLLRRAVGLDQRYDNDPSSEPWPQMPEFTTTDEALSSARLRGRSYVLGFVAADCDKCKAQLQFFRTLREELKDQPVEFAMILVSDEADPQTFRRERELPFPVVGDRGGALRHKLHYRGFVPDTFVVDAEGRIRYRHVAFDDEQPPLYRMELRRLLGLANPPILKPNGPSGVRRCMVCHERQYFDWQASSHAHAMRTLQASGKAEDPECVSCHVVGWQKPGGYDADRGARGPLLTDVQCESCHQDGGPHLAAGHRTITADTCTGCHDHKHSLGFDYDRFVKIVGHSTDLMQSTPEQRAAASRRRDEERRRLLEPDGAYVGAAACAECHKQQHDRWRASPHAGAFERLPENKRQDATCVRCHVTGFERRWAAGTAPAIGDPLANGVQCEACHGPGQRHAAATTADERKASIIGLGARCEQCVIKQICTNCHDRANDADFALDQALPRMQSLCRPAATGR